MRPLSYLIFLFATFCFGISGCKKSPPDPGTVTLKFLTAIQHSNYTEAKQYATKDSKAMLDALSAFQKMLPKSSREKFKKGKISITDVRKKDSLAVVTYVSDEDTTSKTLKLKMQDGVWKVAFTKETVLPDMNQSLTPEDSIGLQPDRSPIPIDSQ